jgi:hypothetical protein
LWQLRVYIDAIPLVQGVEKKKSTKPIGKIEDGTNIDLSGI